MILGFKGLIKAINENTEAQASVLKRLTDIASAQHETNRQLERLSHANENFVNVIQNFFAIRKKIELDEAKRRELREMDLSSSPNDSRY